MHEANRCARQIAADAAMHVIHPTSSSHRRAIKQFDV